MTSLSSIGETCDQYSVCNEPGVSPLVDNDPHFIVHLNQSNMDVCFNIDSKPGDILNLVSDRGTGTVHSYMQENPRAV